METNLQEFDAVAETADIIKKRADEIKVIDNASAQDAADITKELKSVVKKVDAILQDKIAPHKLETEKYRSRAKRITEPLSSAIDYLGSKVKAYQKSEQERLEKIRQDQIKRQQKIQAAEEKRIEKLTAKAEAKGKPAPAIAVPIFVEPPPVEVTKFMRTTTIRRFRIINFEAVPTEWNGLQLRIMNETDLNKYLKSFTTFKSELHKNMIPGLEIYEEKV